MSNGLYPDQNIRSVGTELNSNYLQMLSADKERVGNLGNNRYKAAKYKYKWKMQSSSQDDVKFTNNIDLKKKAIWQLHKKMVLPSFDPGMPD